MKLELIGTTDKLLPDGRVLADGAYGGQTLSEDGKSVTAKQHINPEATSKMDDFYGKSGANGLHEIVELVVGAEKALETGQSVNYSTAHNATEEIAPQSGPANYTIQDGVYLYYVGDGNSPETTLIYNQYKP